MVHKFAEQPTFARIGANDLDLYVFFLEKPDKEGVL